MHPTFSLRGVSLFTTMDYSRILWADACAVCAIMHDKASCLRHSVVDDIADCRQMAHWCLVTSSPKQRIRRIRLCDRKVFKLVIPKSTWEIGTVSCAADRKSEFMTRTILNYGECRLIALRCSSEEDLGNISKRFYEEFHTTKGRCPYAAPYQAPKMQMLMTMENAHHLPRPCRVQGINGGAPIPTRLLVEDANFDEIDKHDDHLLSHLQSNRQAGEGYFYDFAVIGRCEMLSTCLDAFLKRTQLREIKESSTCMSNEELMSILGQWRDDPRRRKEELYCGFV